MRILSKPAMLRATGLLPAIVLLCSGLSAEGPILIPHIGKGGGVTYRVDRADDHFGKERKERETAHQFETTQGTVIGLPDEFGHLKLSRKRGRDLFVALLPGCRGVKDQVIELAELEKGSAVMIVGRKRGYVGGLPRGEERRRILGAEFIFAAEASEDGDEGDKKEQTGILTAKVVSTEPLLVRGADKALYEVRPVTNCRVLSIQSADQADLKKGVEVLVTGYEERVTLRPKGKTLARGVFQARSFRALSSDLAAREYKKILKYELGL